MTSIEIALESDIYYPNVNEIGNYIDFIPSAHYFVNGIKCGCGSCNMFLTRCSFSQHVKTKGHQKWLQSLNNNKHNFFVENEKLQKTVKTQQQIIATLEKEIQNKNTLIAHLSQQLLCPNTHDIVCDLLNFD